MLYRIGETGIQEVSRADWEEMPGGIAVFDEDEWGGELALKEAFSLRKNYDFAVYILKDRLIFIEEGSFVDDLVTLLRKRTLEKMYTMEKFLSDFFMAALEQLGEG